MLSFGGFRVNFKIATGKQRGLENFDKTPGLSLSGAYRINKDELFDKIDYPSSSKQITPSMVKLPVSETKRAKSSKSVNDLSKPENEVIVTQSTPNVSNVSEQLPKNQIKEQKKLEKERLEKQKKQEKITAKEKEKADKLRKDREKQNRKAEEKKKKKRQAPQIQPQTQEPQLLPQPQPRSQSTSQYQEQKQTTKAQARPHGTPRPQARMSITTQPQTTPQKPQTTPQIAIRLDRSEYLTDTLESSISRSSGPPPYTMDDVKKIDNSGNITFKVNDSSWDMIHQHRQTLNRPQVKGLQKQTHLDLNFNTNYTNTGTDMSDA